MFIVSFCIPEYNNAKKTASIVRSMLLSDNHRFQIVVADNASTDCNLHYLEEIKDERFKLVKNKENIGPQKNWCKALDEGEGEFLYFLHAFDTLDMKKINVLFTQLEWMRSNGILCAHDDITISTKIGEGNKVKYNKTNSVVNIIGFNHQTGMIVYREAFKSIRNRYDYFDNVYTYPENYICRDLIRKSHSARICSGLVFSFYDMNTKSSKHGADISKQWFYPDVRCNDLLRVFNMALLDKELNFNRNECSYMISKYWRSLSLEVGIQWRNRMIDVGMVTHYGVNPQIITSRETMCNIFKAYNKITSWSKEHGNLLTIKGKIEIWKWICIRIIQIVYPKYRLNVEYKNMLKRLNKDE